MTQPTPEPDLLAAWREHAPWCIDFGQLAEAQLRVTDQRDAALAEADRLRAALAKQEATTAAHAQSLALAESDDPAESAGQTLARLGIDGRSWAREFLVRFDGYEVNGSRIDEGLMTSWFAGAIESGRTARQADLDRATRERDTLNAFVESTGELDELTDRQKKLIGELREARIQRDDARRERDEHEAAHGRVVEKVSDLERDLVEVPADRDRMALKAASLEWRR